jgi:hypothetical protein
MKSIEEKIGLQNLDFESCAKIGRIERFFFHMTKNIFKLHSEYSPTGDQPHAIGKLMASIDA